MVKLKVRAVEGKIVYLTEALDAKIKRCVGRRKDVSNFDQDELNRGNLSVLNQFPITGEIEEINNTAHYRQAVKEGALVAADQETARICGVSFKE